MSRADVRGVDVLRDFRAALLEFGDQARTILAEVDVQLQHVLDWVGGEQLQHWRQEHLRAERRVVEARLELDRCLLTATSGPSACGDQRLALRRAREYQEFAEEQVRTVLRWRGVVEQELEAYGVRSRQLASTLDGGIPRAVQVLDRLDRHLHDYLSMSPQLATSTALAQVAATTPIAPPATAAAPPVAAGGHDVPRSGSSGVEAAHREPAPPSTPAAESGSDPASPNQE